MEKKAAGIPDDEPGPGKLAQYAALSQVGMEMVAPIGIGVLIDYWRQWGPWGAICGTLLGLFVGIFRLWTLQQNAMKRKKDGESRQGE